MEVFTKHDKNKLLKESSVKEGALKKPLSASSALGATTLLTFVILALCWFVGFASRLFAVIRFESIIHEFDPWFNYRATHYMVENNFYKFLNWFDERAWYPLGRIVGGTVYPGLMVTSGAIHYVLNSLNFPIHIRDVCVFLAPTFSGLTGAGLFAACFIAISPGYTSRSVAGSYDNEGIAIFALQFTYFLWLRSVRTGSVYWAVLTSLSYFYMVSAWGGYVFIINLIPLHVLVLIIIGRYSNRIYVAYSTFYILGQLLAMQIPFVGFQPVKTSEHMAAFGVFGLLQLIAAVQFMQSRITRRQSVVLLIAVVVFTLVLGLGGIMLLTYAGYIAPWSGRFYSLWDTGYAKIHIPLIASVSEHQPTTWVSFFFDLHITAAIFPAGLWLCIKRVNDERVFVILYAITAVYFAGVMVRLMLTLTPVVCVLAGVAFSELFEKYMISDNLKDDDKELPDPRHKPQITSPPNTKGKRKVIQEPASNSNVAANDDNGFNIGLNTRSAVIILFLFILSMYVAHCTYVTSHAYSSPSVVLQSYTSRGPIIMDDFREAYYWLRQNTDENAKVMSWWDYGYQIAGMANRTTLVDNNTWNNTHISRVGQAMSSNESVAYEIMQELDVDYVLVIFGGVTGYSGDDINKFLWMVRIGGSTPEGAHIKEDDYFSKKGEYRVDKEASDIFKQCVMYKLCYYRFGGIMTEHGLGYDRVRRSIIGNKDFKLEHLEEAYTTENWIVRIYRVKKPNNRGL